MSMTPAQVTQRAQEAADHCKWTIAAELYDEAADRIETLIEFSTSQMYQAHAKNLRGKAAMYRSFATTTEVRR